MASTILKHVISYHRSYGRSANDERVEGHRPTEHVVFSPLLTIISSGSSRWPKGRFFSRSSSELCGIELVTMGNAIFVQDGRHYEVGPGEVFLLRRGARHRYETGPAGFLHKRFVALEGTLLQSILQLTGLLDVDVVRPSSAGQTVGFLKHAHLLLRTKPPEMDEMLPTVAFELLQTLAQGISPGLPESVRKAVAHIRRNLEKPLSVADLSDYAGLSPTHFQRLFRKHVGMPPMRYAISQRMQWAQYLLVNTVLSVKEIGLRLGFDDPLYFSAQFKKHAGVSPKHYRMRDGGMRGYRAAGMPRKQRHR